MKTGLPPYISLLSTAFVIIIAYTLGLRKLSPNFSLGCCLLVWVFLVTAVPYTWDKIRNRFSQK